MQSAPLLVHTIQPTADVTACRFISPTGAVPAAGANTLGIVRSDTLAGDDAPVTVIGTEIIEISEALAAGVFVETTNDGRAAALSAGVAVARLLQAGTVAGQKVEALLLPN